MTKKTKKNKKRARPQNSPYFKKTVLQNKSLSLEQIFQLALHNFQVGNLGKVEELCKQTLQVDADNADVNHLLGVVYAQQGGKHDLAIHHIRHSLSMNDKNPEAHNNLGKVFQDTGRFDEAISSYRKALSLKNEYLDALTNLGLVFQEADRLDEAEIIYRKLLSIDKDSLDAHFNLGVVLQKTGRLEESIASYKQALSINPVYAEAYNNLGLVFNESGKVKEAIASFRHALSINPGYAGVHNNLGIVLQESGRQEEAIASYRQALSINPSYAEVYKNLGNTLHETGNLEESIVCYMNAVNIKPDYISALSNLGVVLQETGRLDEAVAIHQKVLLINPDHEESHNNLGVALNESGRHEEAIISYKKALSINPGFIKSYLNLGIAQHELSMLDEALNSYEEVLSLDPDYAQAHFKIGIVLHEKGMMAEAVAKYRKVISLQPDYVEAFRHLTLMVKPDEIGDDLILAMKELYLQEDLSDDNKIQLGFALGKLYADQGEYAKSFSYIFEANRLNRQTYNYSVQVDQDFFKRIKKTFSPSFVSSYRDYGRPDASPIFIIGMPRSGTTLVEQVLSSHSQVFGAGELGLLAKLIKKLCINNKIKPFPEGITEFELEDFRQLGEDYMGEIRSYDKKSEYIINKLPNNYLFVGLIKIIFPNAKVIHCMRNPMDNCLSIFKNYFAKKGTHKYAYDLVELGMYYNHYKSLIDHWEKVVPGFMHTVKYEEMVLDQQGQTEKLLEFCGLSWDEACMFFYKTKRKVNTASFMQVRKPIYKDSVELWKRYEKQLEPLQKAIYG